MTTSHCCPHESPHESPHETPHETEESVLKASSSTLSFIYDPELALDWEQQGKKQINRPSAYNTSLGLNGDDQKCYDDDSFSNYDSSFALAERLTVSEEDGSLLLFDEECNLPHHRSVISPQALNHAAFLPAMETSTDNFQVQGMHPLEDTTGFPRDLDTIDPFCVAKSGVEANKEPSMSSYAFNYDAGHIAKKTAATATSETKNASVEIEQDSPLMLTPAGVGATCETETTPQDADGGRNPSDSLERNSKRLKLDFIPVDVVDVPLDYTSQKSTIGHQVWRRDEIRGPRRLISEEEAKELIKKHREELTKLGYSREPVFLVKEGNTRAKKDSPLYTWTRNGKSFRYRRASLAAIQYAVNQNTGNNSSKRTSLAEVIQQCEETLKGLDKTQSEIRDNAAVLQMTLWTLKKFCGKEYSSMLQIERVREKSLTSMLTRMLQELGPLTPQVTTKASSDDKKKKLD